ncbi:MAG: hypothetical protein ACKPJD_09095, partial [Planctomycetaceae bacterium]
WNCPPDEVVVFEDELRSVAQQQRLQWLPELSAELVDGLPDLTVRVLPGEAGAVAEHLLSRPGLRIVQIAALGVLHVYGAEAGSLEPDAELRQQLDQTGGDWSGRHQSQRAGVVAESIWRRILLEEFQQP